MATAGSRAKWNRASGALATLWLVAVATPAAAAGQLRSLALNSSADGTVLDLQLSSSVGEKVFTLSSPARIVIDLPDTRRFKSLPTPAGAGIVDSVRVGPQSNGTLRVVLQLKNPSQYRLVRQSSAAGYALQVRLGNAATATRGGATRVASVALPSNPPADTVSASAANVVEAVPAPPVATQSIVKSAPQEGGDIVIAVDAGHGGVDPGATGMRGTHEKDVTLAIARALAARIDREPGMRAVLTRGGDYFVPLRDRMVRARNAKADLFVSIHADAVRDRDVSGSSVYVVSNRGASSEAAHWLADRENAADLKGGVSLADVSDNLASVLVDLSQSANQGASVEAAAEVLKSLDDLSVVRKHQVQYAAFVVLKSPDLPSLLVETAYISNPAEERRLASANGQLQLAQSIFTGLQRYFGAHPPAGSLYARKFRARGGGGGIQLARSTE